MKIVLGMGGWGTAIANLLAAEGAPVRLWGRDPVQVAEMRRERRNTVYLPSVPLAPSVEMVEDLACVRDASIVVFVVPSRATRSLAQQVAELGLQHEAILVSGTKGFEYPSGKRITQILAESFPQNPVGVLSGPNHAEEVGLGMPTASVLGATTEEAVRHLQKAFSTRAFRTYSSHDPTGIELGGALKNIYALAAGVGDGLGLGDNSKAALVTRCLAEMIRLGVALGGNRDTFQGLSGIGDLMVTCFSRHSRNRGVGERIGRGETLEQIRGSMRAVAEGVPTAETAVRLARAGGVETPVLDQVFAVLFEGRNPKDAIRELMSRDLRSEADDR